MSTSEDIFVKVKNVLVESLTVDESDITPNSRLQGDLGAESIDFLDVLFRLEREFDIVIPRGELFPSSVFKGDPEFVQEGRVTDQGMNELRSLLPYADLTVVENDRHLTSVADLFTVDMLNRYIAWKIGHHAVAANC